MKTQLQLMTLAACFAGCATDDQPDLAQREAIAAEEVIHEIVPVEPQPQLDKEGNPMAGTLVIDTSEGRMDLTDLVPVEPRRFDSWEQFHTWAQKELNAKILTNDKGEMASQLSVQQTPGVRIDAQSGELVDVEDPIGAIIGGTFGYVYVGDELVCTSATAECAKEQVLPGEAVGGTDRNHLPSYVRRIQGRMDTDGQSYLFHALFYHETRAVTRYYGGSFLSYNYVCNWWPLRYCNATSGSNSLTASFSATRALGNGSAGSQRASGFNTYGVSAINFAVGMGPTAAGLSIVSEADGMCSSHTASDNGNGFLSFMTAAGFHGFGC